MISITGEVEQIDFVNKTNLDLTMVNFNNTSFLYFKSKEIEIKLGDAKVKSSVHEILLALKDALDTDIIEIDSISDQFRSMESDLEEVRNPVERFTNPNDWEE